MANDKQTERIQNLAKKWQEGSITPEEKQEFEAWYDGQENIFELNTAETKDQTEQRILDQLLQKAGLAQPKTRLWPRIAAASILLALGFGGYFILHKQPQQIAQSQIHDAKPGGNKAILTLAGGKQVILTGAKNGTIARQGNAAINKTASGQIVYNANPVSVTTTEVVMNTITTPRGGKWFVVLSDGTKVWLNAASSITYPTTFTGSDRQVTITGEAYFEVAHNAARPFKVVSNGQTVEDIGTSFDINSYSDEPDNRTTLVEGSIKVSTTNGSAILKPGQQAKVKSGLAITVINDQDMERTLAWKNGLFIFNRTDLYTLMRQLSRWYDVDVVFQDGVKNDVFFGKIKQDNNLSEILKVLELGDVHFRIEGKKLIVLP